tara:strand:- start:24613 stop:25164 length:552 start_codon:yes stop_codon:yes gene_type:complete
MSLKPIASAIRILANFLVYLSGLLAICLMVHVSLDACYRYFFNKTFGATIEIASLYYMVPLCVLPLAKLILDDKLLKVTFATELLPLKRQRQLDKMNAVILVVGFGLLGYASLLEALDKTRKGEVWESIAGLIQAWPSRWVLPVAFGLAICAGLRVAILGAEPQINDTPFNDDVAPQNVKGEA